MAYQRVSDKQFAQSKHQYTLPGTGERVMSVTTVVGAFDPTGDKLGAGAGAAVKLTKAGIDYRAEWNAKRDLGTRVHGFAQLWMEGQSAEIPESDYGYMEGFIKFCDHKEPEWLTVERAVVHSAGYGGRFDAIGYFDDLYWLLDLKSGRTYETELALQLAGYRYADGMIVYDDEGWAVDLDPMPHIDRCAGLYLHGDGGYTLVPVEADEEAHAVFLGILRAKQWAKAQKVSRG